MIALEKISIDWLDNVSKSNRNADRILVEKVIRALLLLEGLVKQNLPFVFKGGTALMLHFNSTKRLSIDVDIIIPNSINNLETILDEIVKSQGFIRWELQERNASSKIKKEHYKLYYSPLHKTIKDEEYVLLDILYEQVTYQNLVSLPIQSDFVPQSGTPLTVEVPSLEDILGDKMTAFAPNTTGIPYYKNGNSMSMEIIKQLYDIGNLFDLVSNTKVIRKTFLQFAKTELEYRAIDENSEIDVLDDIFQTALCLSSRGQIGRGNFNELQSGVKRIKGFIFSENYHIEKAIQAASKAAYLSQVIKYEKETIEKFKDSNQIKDFKIENPEFNKLNKLKKSNPEALFYWYKTIKLIRS